MLCTIAASTGPLCALPNTSSAKSGTVNSRWAITIGGRLVWAGPGRRRCGDEGDCGVFACAAASEWGCTLSAKGLFGSCGCSRQRHTEPRNAAAFEQLYLDNEAALYDYLARRLGPSSAEDAVAETFAAAWQCFAHLETSTKVRTWLMGFAIEKLRARRDDELAYLDCAHAGSSAPRVARALAELEAIDRDMLTLRVWAELSDECIAQLIGLPSDLVGQRVHAALQFVRHRSSDLR